MLVIIYFGPYVTEPAIVAALLVRNDQDRGNGQGTRSADLANSSAPWVLMRKCSRCRHHKRNDVLTHVKGQPEVELTTSWFTRGGHCDTVATSRFAGASQWRSGRCRSTASILRRTWPQVSGHRIGASAPCSFRGQRKTSQNRIRNSVISLIQIKPKVPKYEAASLEIFCSKLAAAHPVQTCPEDLLTRTWAATASKAPSAISSWRTALSEQGCRCRAQGQDFQRQLTSPKPWTFFMLFAAPWSLALPGCVDARVRRRSNRSPNSKLKDNKVSPWGRRQSSPPHREPSSSNELCFV